MTTRIETFFTMDSGKAIYSDPEKFKQAIHNLPNGVYINRIERLYNTRTIKQNNSAWGIAEKMLRACLSESFGYEVSKEYCHEILMEQCLPQEYKEQLRDEYNANPVHITNHETGEVIQIPFRYTTTKMTTVQSKQYYMNLQTCKELLSANDLSTTMNIVLLHLSDGNSNALEFKSEIEGITGKPVFIADKGLEIDLNIKPF
jgi:hypothetical protein